jgi:lactate dehydrogenase-like 2-hydroxyacid dehydrogenase
VIDEAALVEHLKANPMFRVGLDVFEVKKTLLVKKFSRPIHQHAMLSRSANRMSLT